MINTQNLTYSKYCKHCKYLKTHPKYRHEIFNSTYYDKGAAASVPQTLEKYNPKITLQTVYNCLRNHFNQFSRPGFAETLENTIKVLDGDDLHEQALDRFIKEGDKLVQTGQMDISASNYIAAINAKTNIQKNKGDRKLELIRDFFLGGDKDGKPEIPKTAS